MRKSTMAAFVWFRKLFPKQRTLSHQDVLPLYREPGILSGYRQPGKPWHYYIASIFQLHNETVNIWTHTVACCIFIFRLYDILHTFELKADCEALPLVAFSACVIISTFLSVVAHTFLSKSPLCHYVCLLMDYAGVGIYGLGKCILFFFISSPHDIYKYLDWIYLPYNVFLSWVVMTGCCVAKLFYKRPYPFQRRLIQLGAGGLHAVFGGIPMTLRFMYCISDPGCEISSLAHHLSWIVTMIISLFFFSSHLPEKKFPGLFDYFGQGHSLFHVIISYTVLLQYRSAHHDIIHRDVKKWSCQETNGVTIFAAIILYCIGCIVIILFLRKYVRKRIESDEKHQN